MKKQIIHIVLLILCMLLLIGCQGIRRANDITQTDGKILFLHPDLSDTFLKTVSDSALEYAVQNQIDLTVIDAQGSIELQAAQMKEAKNSGYNIVICIPVDGDTVQELIAAANNLPVVFVNRCPEESLLEPNRYIYVGSDEHISGAYQAEFLADYFKGKSSIKVVLLKGVKTESAAILRTESVKDGLKKAGIVAEYVFEDSANWSREEAKKLFGIFLKLNREFDCVICNNDEMALGVIDACIENGIDPTKFPILGVDATEGGKQAIMEGSMDFTVLQSAKGQAEMAVEAAKAIIQGKGIHGLDYATEDECYIWVPFEKVDKSSLK